LNAPASAFVRRHGYFVADRHGHAPGRPVFSRIAPLKDAWAK